MRFQVCSDVIVVLNARAIDASVSPLLTLYVIFTRSESDVEASAGTTAGVAITRDSATGAGRSARAVIRAGERLTVYAPRG